MVRNYSRNLVMAAGLLVSATACVTTQTPSPSATPAAPPPLPKIVEIEKPAVYSYDPAKLAAPFATQSVARASRVVRQPENAKLSVPKGFKVNVFAEGDFRYPRWMALAPNGDVFVADSRANSVVVL